MMCPIGSVAKEYIDAFGPAESVSERVEIGVAVFDCRSHILIVRSKEPDAIQFLARLDEMFNFPSLGSTVLASYGPLGKALYIVLMLSDNRGMSCWGMWAPCLYNSIGRCGNHFHFSCRISMKHR